MSRKLSIALALAIVALLPAPAHAQFGVGVRAGTIGVGGEVSVGVTPLFGIRAGIGFMPSEISQTLDDVEYTLEPPSTLWNVGVDFYPTGGNFRISAGLLNRKQIDMTYRASGSQRIGNRDYNGTVTIDGTLTNAQEIAPFAAIGFGKTFESGVGLFFDLGAARMGDANIELVGTCVLGDGSACPEFPPNLDAEEQFAEDEAGGFLQGHPIIQIGLKLGLSR